MTNSQDSFPASVQSTPGEPGEEALEPVPMTEDGIPMKANGRLLSEMEINILREARDRRAQKEAEHMPKEVGGAARGTEPTRYGDWEKEGRAVDFS